MEYRNLGRSGVKVSPICLGTMMFGGPTDEATAARIVASARDAGVNFIDTADQYTDGRSEEITGRAIKAKRDWWVLATKVANPTGEGAERQWAFRANGSCRPATRACRRLGTDYVDIYYLHKEDHGTPLAETVRAMADLMRAGKIRYFGVSNYRAWRVAEICRICDDIGIDRPVVSPALLQRHEPDAGGRAPAGLRPLRPRRRALLAARPRRAHRQVFARGSAAAGHPRRPPGSAHDADRVAHRIARDRAGDQAPRGGARHQAGSVRSRLGAQQPPRHLASSPARAPRSSGRIISARSTTASRPRTRPSSTASCPPATRQRPAITIRPTRSRAAWRGPRNPA